MTMPTLYSIVDPMCSWCWGFYNEHQTLLENLPGGVEHEYLMGGLAPDSDAPMEDSMKEYIQNAWRAVTERTGARFNFDFWEKCQPRRSTYPACRAVVAAGLQGKENRARMLLGIHQAYYLDAQNPSDLQTLIEIAEKLELDRLEFTRVIDSAQVHHLFEEERILVNKLGSRGFPSLVLQHRGKNTVLMSGYSPAKEILDSLRKELNEEAIQP